MVRPFCVLINQDLPGIAKQTAVFGYLRNLFVRNDRHSSWQRKWTIHAFILS